jgi:hypothetical protein
MKQDFIEKVNMLSQDDPIFENRLFSFKDYKKDQEFPLITEKLKSCNLRSLKVNFMSCEEPIINLYKTDNFEKTIGEYLALPKNNVFFHPPSSVNKKVLSNFSETAKLYRKH